MARRTISEAQLAVVVDERAGVLTHMRRRCNDIDAIVARGRMDADMAVELKRRLKQFADDIAIGLHIDGADFPGVRDAMRPIVKAAQDD